LSYLSIDCKITLCWTGIFSCESLWNVRVSEAAFDCITNCLNVHCDRYLSVLAMSSVVVVELTLIDVLNTRQFDDFSFI